MILILVFVFGLLAAASGAFGFFFAAAALTVLARRAFSLFLLAFVVFFAECASRTLARNGDAAGLDEGEHASGADIGARCLEETSSIRAMLLSS